MRRILFVVIPEKGHLHPYIGPAARLVDRGHRVAFYAAHDVSAHLRRAGFEHFFAGEAEPSPPPDANRGRVFADHVRDRDWLRGWIKRLLVDNVPPQVEVLRRVVREFRPHVLAIDPMVYQGAIAAELEGVPWAGLSSSLNPVVPDHLESELIATNRWFHADRDALFARYRLQARFRVCDCLSRDLNVAFTTAELVGPPPEDVILVGPSLPVGPRGDECDFPWERLNEHEPVIYMSLGSQIYFQPRMFRTVVDAVRGRPVQLVISVGDLLSTGLLGELPANVVAVPYAPQLQLLERAAVMVTHGGANSVMEALTFGVPLLITPICNDQFHNAFFVGRSGAGIRLDLDTATPFECWQTLAELLGPEPYRESARRLRHSYAMQDGAEAAAWLVEQLAEQGGQR